MLKYLPSLLLVGFLGFGAGCEGEGGITLLVELKTDLVPGTEFAAVRTEVAAAAEPTNTLSAREVDVALGRDLTAGRRVAELDRLEPGTYVVRVTLVDIGGSEVLRRDVVVTATGTTGFTVLMTRDCVDVRCPMVGGDPALMACVGGRCVEPRCTPEAPEYCPVPECTAASECSDPVSSCAEPVCEDGTCLVRTETAVCAAGEYCDPTAGCRGAPGDGGPTDAAPMDAGPGDASADAGATDADTGDADAMVGLPTWAQQAYVKASNTDASDAFGLAAALSADGNTLAVGAGNEASAVTGIGGDQTDDSASQAGAVYVFVRSGGAWAQQAYLKASNTEQSDIFGRTVALSADGNTLAVGAYIEDSAATGVGGDQGDNAADAAGAVYVFVRAGASWAQQAYVKASNTDAGDTFGYLVSLSGDGDTLAVGAIGESSVATGVDGDQGNNGSGSAGAVYVFVRAGVSWTQQAYLKASNTGPDDRFGYSVSLSDDGDTLAVGAYFEDSAATGIDGVQGDDTAIRAGAVYVFARVGVSWTQQAYLKASNTDAGDAFGFAVSLSGDGNTLAVGAFVEQSAATGVGGDAADDMADNAGAVYVFVRSGAVWSQQAYVKASNTAASDFFGRSVSLSRDGNTMAVGTPGEDSAVTGIGGDESDEAADGAGAVYVFVRSGAVWSQQAYVKASNTDASDGFGTMVRLNGDGSRLAVGATVEASSATGVGGDQSDDSALGAGAVYVFARTFGG